MKQHWTLKWRHNEHDGLTVVYWTVYSRRRSKKTSKPHVIGRCEGNSLVTGEFPAQRASKAEKVSIWWRHHEDIGQRNKWMHWEIKILLHNHYLGYTVHAIHPPYVVFHFPDAFHHMIYISWYHFYTIGCFYFCINWLLIKVWYLRSRPKLSYRYSLLQK